MSWLAEVDDICNWLMSVECSIYHHSLEPIDEIINKSEELNRIQLEL